jgi:nitroimidazol reductase NimA-like FMN-containing flavoprotein (pyridoxamine 5'-phosphate oxidase superfamily)
LERSGNPLARKRCAAAQAMHRLEDASRGVPRAVRHLLGGDAEDRDMLGELTHDEIEQLLLRGNVGRIGCHAENRTYVVPITYAYDGECVYAHSADGLKIRTMRANPNVCFEVDHIVDLAHWSSVIAWGIYEELSGAPEERAAALLLSRRLGPLHTSATALMHPRIHGIAQESSRTTLFRIRPTEKTGRFER